MPGDDACPFERFSAATRDQREEAESQPFACPQTAFHESDDARLINARVTVDLFERFVARVRNYCQLTPETRTILFYIGEGATWHPWPITRIAESVRDKGS